MGDEARMWRRCDSSLVLVYDYDNEVWRPSTEGAIEGGPSLDLPAVIRFERGEKRVPHGRRREQSHMWKEHIEDVHAGTVDDCATEEMPRVFESVVGEVRKLEIEVVHDPEGSYPYCGHMAVLMPKNLEDSQRNRIAMRLAGRLKLIHPLIEVDSLP